MLIFCWWDSVSPVSSDFFPFGDVRCSTAANEGKDTPHFLKPKTHALPFTSLTA